VNLRWLLLIPFVASITAFLVGWFFMLGGGLDTYRADAPRWAKWGGLPIALFIPGGISQHGKKQLLKGALWMLGSGVLFVIAWLPTQIPP
jgi:hypothetical protein